MARVGTLNEISQLEQSRFGRPPPRHGLKLLYWFATECVSFDYSNDMVSECDPKRRDFGFHRFENRCDQNNVRLLPDVYYPYYIVGNLNSEGADELPDYIREDYTGHQDGSNMDRIIVSLNDKWFDRVYVTEHIDRSNYNSKATYRISKGLLKIIRSLEMDDFLRKTGYQLKQWYYIQRPDQDNLIPCPQMLCVALETPTVNPPRNQDTRIEIDSPPGRQSAFSGHNSEMYVRSNKKNRCCQCTIL